MWLGNRGRCPARMIRFGRLTVGRSWHKVAPGKPEPCMKSRVASQTPMNESQMSLLGFRVHARSSRCFYRRLHQHRDAAAAAEAVAAAAERSLSTKPAQGRLNKRPSPQTTKTRRPQKGATHRALTGCGPATHPAYRRRRWKRLRAGIDISIERVRYKSVVSPVRPARPRLGKSEEQISALSPARSRLAQLELNGKRQLFKHNTPLRPWQTRVITCMPAQIRSSLRLSRAATRPPP